MGSNRFYEHAQNLLGGVKREVGNKRTVDKKDFTIIMQDPRQLAPVSPRQVAPRQRVLLRQPVAHPWVLPSKKLALRQSALPRQLVPGNTVLPRQPVPLPHKQFTAVSTDPQVVSTSVSQAVSSWEDSASF